MSWLLLRTCRPLSLLDLMMDDIGGGGSGNSRELSYDGRVPVAELVEGDSPKPYADKMLVVRLSGLVVVAAARVIMDVDADAIR